MNGPVGQPTDRGAVAVRHGSVRCLSPSGFHRMAFTDCGPVASPCPVVCVHGLTRNGRDFDRLAEALSPQHRVVCPDIVGRGLSDRLRDPSHYALPQYCADMAVLLAALGAERVDWVGTSMGGLVGLALAASPGSPIRRLVLNDVGPFLSAEALAGIAAGASALSFDTRMAAEAGIRQAVAGFGPLTEEDYRHLFAYGLVAETGGGYARTVDPAIFEPIAAAPRRDVDLWAWWERVTCPVLVIRGETSPLLTPDIVARMANSGPKAQIWEARGCGHAPSLMTVDQIAVVRSFFDDG